jgi:hypothetical protein
MKTEIKIKRLKALQKAIKTGKVRGIREKIDFDMRTVSDGRPEKGKDFCGSVCCIAGFANLLEAIENGELLFPWDYIKSAQAYLGLNQKQLSLFIPRAYTDCIPISKKAKQAALVQLQRLIDNPRANISWCWYEKAVF